MTLQTEYISKQKATKIIGIQFSVLSPEEIRNGSCSRNN